MKQTLMGFVLGFILGVAVASFAVTVIGDGYLIGWEVTKNGETVCNDPYVWSGIMEIECD